MATRLMASGIDSQTARLITGHKDAATFEQYRQLQRTAILQAGKKLESSQKTLRVHVSKRPGDCGISRRYDRRLKK
jgi:hypothetical protein